MYTIKSLGRVLWACRAIIGAAALASVLINVLHGYVFSGNGWAMFLAAFPPTFVITSAEVISRVPVAPNRNRLRRWARPTAMLGLALGGAYLSYFAQRDVIYHFSGSLSEARVLPLLVDGFVLIMSMTVYEINERRAAMDTARRSQEAGEIRPTPQRRKGNSFTAREQVAVLLSKDPNLTPKDLATRVGISAGYASTLAKELRPELNGSELVGIE